MSGERTEGGYPAANEERYRVVDEALGREEVGKRAVVLPGVTVSLGLVHADGKYIFNDGPGGEGYLGRSREEQRS